MTETTQTTPDQLQVSVVLSVHDQPDLIVRTVDSVLAQRGVAVQLVIIDDGSDTDVQELLQTYRSNPDVIIERQPNQGLTSALIRGCELAEYRYIARIDTGDCMLPGRLAAQAAHLASSPTVGFVCCWVEVTTPEGYPLYTVDYSAADLRYGLTTSHADQSASPFHASVMMRRDLYREVGGYRREFYFAQDLDLWSRMIMLADIDVIEEVLTTGLFSPTGLSGRHADAQRRLRELIVRMRSIEQESSRRALLVEAAKVRPGPSPDPIQDDAFGGFYFIARQLASQGSAQAGDYFLRALRLRPLSLRARLAYWHWLVTGGKS